MRFAKLIDAIKYQINLAAVKGRKPTWICLGPAERARFGAEVTGFIYPAGSPANLRIELEGQTFMGVPIVLRDKPGFGLEYEAEEAACMTQDNQGGSNGSD